MEEPIPTVQVNLASASRKATFLARLEMPARVERMVGIAEGDVAVRTRKVACLVRGAVTGWELAVVMLLMARVDLVALSVVAVVRKQERRIGDALGVTNEEFKREAAERMVG